MQLILSNFATSTSRIEVELHELFESITQEYECISGFRKVLFNNLKGGLSSLEEKVTGLENELNELLLLQKNDAPPPEKDEDGGTNILLVDLNNNNISNNNNDNDIELGEFDEDANFLAGCQYERLDCIEINGIPVLDNDIDLQETACNILQQIGVPVADEDFLACYRLYEPTMTSGVAPTICGFSDRKMCKMAHENKKKLRDVKLENVNSGELFINDFLCWYYKKLAAKCRRLKKNGQIRDTWIFKGTVKIRLHNSTVRPIKHQTDLNELFPNYAYFD